MPVAFVLGHGREDGDPAPLRRARYLDGGVGGCVGKHQALFVHPCSHPRIDAVKPAAGGRRKAARLSTEHTGWCGRGVGFAFFTLGQAASLRFMCNGRKGEQGAGPSIHVTLSFLFLELYPARPSPASQASPGHASPRRLPCRYKANLSPHQHTLVFPFSNPTWLLSLVTIALCLNLDPRHCPVLHINPYTSIFCLRLAG